MVHLDGELAAARAARRAAVPFAIGALSSYPLEEAAAAAGCSRRPHTGRPCGMGPCPGSGNPELRTLARGDGRAGLGQLLRVVG
ncbi:hypothetical protein ACFU7T_28495 [Streptomyces sp. NPDC057555]|uniref:hypothetical protein n=1 Tax=Streptomyces sp. NPDC057555 TaxID=3346166 RepID=UPI0036AC934B